jgi:hypothetical protein
MVQRYSHLAPTHLQEAVERLVAPAELRENFDSVPSRRAGVSIDPQIVLADGNGNRIRHSVQSYWDAYEAHAETLKRDPNNAVARLMLSKLDPATVKLFEAVRDRARTFAENQLKLGMFTSGTGNYTKIAADLLTHDGGCLMDR